MTKQNQLCQNVIDRLLWSELLAIISLFIIYSMSIKHIRLQSCLVWAQNTLSSPKNVNMRVFFFLLMNGSDETSAKSFFSVLRLLWRGWFHAACPNLISYKIYISNGNGHCCYTRCCQSGNTLAKMLYHSFSRTWFHRCPHWQPMGVGGWGEWCMLVELCVCLCPPLTLCVHNITSAFICSTISDTMIMDAIASYLVLPNRLTVPLVPDLQIAQLRSPLPRVTVSLFELLWKQNKTKKQNEKKKTRSLWKCYFS